jgi:cyanate permease
MEEHKSNFRWLVLGLLFLNIFFVFLATACMPPLFKEIGEDFPLTRAQMGLIMGVLTLPSLFFSPIGGGITDRIGSRWAFGTTVLIIAIGGAFRGTVGNAYGLTVCMLLMGVGTATLAPNISKSLGMWFPSNEFAMANGICLVAMPLASTVGMGTAAGILSPALGGWRNVMIIVGILTLITSLLWFVLFRDRELLGTAEKKKQSFVGNFKKVFKVKDVWWLSIFYGFRFIGSSSLMALLPHSLSERGMSGATAGAFVAIMMGANSIFKVLGGTASDKTGRRKPFLFIASIILGVCVFAFATFKGVPLIIALIIGGAAMGCVSPIFMATVVEIKEIGPALAGTTLGLVFMIGNVFGFIGPVVSGKLMDITGAQWPGFVFMGLAYLVASFCILPVRETGQRKKSKTDSMTSDA